LVLLEGFCGRVVTFSDGKLSSKDASMAAVKASISTPKSISFTGLELTLNASVVKADMGTFFEDSVEGGFGIIEMVSNQINSKPC
jgi:hypothetical protein